MKNKFKDNKMTKLLLTATMCAILMFGAAACNSATNNSGNGGSMNDGTGAPAMTDDVIEPTVAPDGVVTP